MMFQYCIYERPEDYPTKYVIRQWMIMDGNPVPVPGLCGTADTLEEVRVMVPRGHVCLARNEEDAPCIVETWI